MPPESISSKIHWRYRRFWRLFRREKRSLIDLTYSYQYMMRFPRLPITVPPLVPTLMTYRWNDDDEYDLSPKKHLRNNNNQQQQPFRRRLSKRYSDIVGPTSTKVHLPQNDSSVRKKPPLSPHKHYRTSFKRNPNEGIYVINSHNKKSSEVQSSLSRTKKTDSSIITRRYNSKNKSVSTTNSVDLLAHRMQAAMSSELMYSLDRNFVFGDRKQTSNSTYINRSQSFQVSSIQPTNDWWENSLPKKTYSHHIIPRVKECLDEEQQSISSSEPTPDYEDEEITHIEISEEPTIDYDDIQSIQTSQSHYDLGVSLSCNAPQTSLTPSSEIGTQEQSTIPPTPPPLPAVINDEKQATFRCRTIADKITLNHKLILKDEDRTKTAHYNNLITPSKPCHLHISKELLEKTTLRKVSHPVSRSYSTYGSMSQINDHNTESTTLCQKSSIIDEQSPDTLSSSATTSIVIENEYEHRVSSKIYNDYKRRTSLINVPTSDSAYSHSAIIHPMHAHIGLRSGTNDKLNDISLSNKQMNICVINQLNQHLSTRFSRQQEQELCSKKNITIIKEIEEKINVYDEPQNIEIPKKSLDTLTPSIPPPPPPLPVGGFRPVISAVNSQRTSIMTLPREGNNNNNNSDLGGSTGTSTTSSKLSDTRILRELRTNPLFAKAKQHLEIDNGRLNESQYDTYLKKSSSTIELGHIERFLIHSDEFNSIIDKKSKRIKSNDINQQSELELIFQKRAQRNE